MAFINYYKNYEKEFGELISNKENLKDLNIDGIISEKKDNSNYDLTKLVSCSKNIFEDLIKIHSNSQLVLNIIGNSNIKISGSGIVYIIINENSSLNIEYDLDVFSGLYLKVLIKKSVNCEIIDNSNNYNLWKNIEFILEENSSLNYFNLNYGSRYLVTKSYLYNNSKFNLNSIYYLKKDSFIENYAYNLEKNSYSNLDIKGVAYENSTIINNAIINISKMAINSKGFQLIKNLIVDSNSKIISNPILEINNNLVECSHSASTLQIEEDILYYMNSKGISKEIGLNLILEGFKYSLIQKISNKNLIL